MEEVKTAMDTEAAGAEDSTKPVTDSNEIAQPEKEGMDSTEAPLELNDVTASDSQNEKADSALQDEEVGKSDAQEESSSAVDSVSESELVRDDSSKVSEVESTKCLTEVVQGVEVDEKSSDDVAPCEEVQEKVEVTTSLQETRTMSETATVQQQSTSVSETVSKFTSEESSTQVVKQTVVSSSQESTITHTMDSLTTETDLKVNGTENLLDPDKVSELRRSPYYDSLIANRISMESEGMSSKTVQKEEQSVGGSSAVTEEKLNDDVHPTEQKAAEVTSLNQTGIQVNGSSSSQSDMVTKGVSSLKKACQEAVNASPQINRSVTPSTVMFKVTKFEAKPFSEVKSNSEWTYSESSLFKSGESTISSHQASEVSTTIAEQVQSTEDDMGVPPANEDVPFRFSPNAYKPPPEDEMDFVDLPRKKKMFSSSSFYEEPNAIYPTVEEQVELCRKIADSLSDDSNKKSKGANMFFKRVKKAEKWAVESIGTGYDSDYYESSRSESVGTPDPSKIPYVRVSKGPPQLKLILDPRHLLDMKRLRQEGVNIVEHNAVSPEICLDLVKDLNSPTGRGAQLFAKRKKKSEEWVVDEEKVRQLLREREYGYTSSPEPPTIPCGVDIEPLVFPRVQMVKTPWAAAMESPIGSCAGAFKELHPNEVAESVIRAAETKVMTYPTPCRPVIEPVIKPESSVQIQNYPSSTAFTPAVNAFVPAPAPQSHPPKLPRTTSFKAGVYTADPYKPRAPKGWTGTSSGGSQFFSIQHGLPAAQEPVQHQPSENLIPQGQTPSMPSSKLTHQPSITRAYSFTNFNKTPRAWNEAATSYQNVYIKPVKPPSVLVQ